MPIDAPRALTFAAAAVAVRPRAARRHRRAFRGAQARAAGAVERTRADALRVSPSRTAPFAAPVSRPISRACWPGATGISRTRRARTASPWARSAGATAHSCSASWARTRRMPAASIFRPARRTRTTSVGATVDLEGSVRREVDRGDRARVRHDFDAEPGWHAVLAGPRIALMKILQARESAAELRKRILDHLAREREPELADIRIVRGPADLDPDACRRSSPLSLPTSGELRVGA